MTSSGSKTSERNDDVSGLQSNKSVEILWRQLHVYRRGLEKDLLDEIKDCVDRPSIWIKAYYNECAEILSKRREEFFHMTCSLIEKCEADEGGQYESST